jgi:hypothetical protein
MTHPSRMRILLFVLVIFSTSFACKLFQEEQEKTTAQGFYTIQPETLLSALAQGETNAFVPITEDEVNAIRLAPPTASPVNWTQDDYFYIVEAFYRGMLNDTLQGWHLQGMDFSLSCNEVDIGLQQGGFSFFKVIRNENNEDVLISRFIGIEPAYKVVLFWEREFYPYVVPRSSIDLASIKFDSAKVLQIAEDNGGRKQRLALNNQCSISLMLGEEPGIWYRIRYGTAFRWQVLYSGWNENRGITFLLTIDPFTGELH